MKYERLKKHKNKNLYNPQQAYDDTVKEVNAGVRNAFNNLIKIVLAYSSAALGLFIKILSDRERISITLCGIDIFVIVVILFSVAIILTILILVIEQKSLLVSLDNMEEAVRKNIDDSNKLPNRWYSLFYILEILIVVSVIFGTIFMSYYYISILI